MRISPQMDKLEEKLASKIVTARSLTEVARHSSKADKVVITVNAHVVDHVCSDVIARLEVSAAPIDQRPTGGQVRVRRIQV